MITIKASAMTRNAAAFAAIKRKIVEEGDKQYRQRVLYMLKEAATVSAQFSGDYVSNWRIRVSGQAEAPYNMWPNKNPAKLGKLDLGQSRVYQAGDPEAINFAVTRAKFVPFGMKDKVYLVNATPLTFTGTTVTGPDGDTRPLRPENIIGSGERIHSYMNSRFGGK
jgi:hypothetical protein